MSDKKQKTYPVQLLKDHKHAGKKEPAGKTIYVSAMEKQWLEANKIVVNQPAPEPVAPAAAATQPAKKG